jgi:hypothetical protein
MKKNNVISLISTAIFITLFIFACDTKDDPPVPNHTVLASTSSTATTSSSGSTTTTGATANTLVFGSANFSLLGHGCSIDTSFNNHYIFLGADTVLGVIVYVLIGETTAPTSTKTYTIVSPSSTLSSTEAFIHVSETDEWSSTISSGGTFTVTYSSGNIVGSFSGITLTKDGGTDTKISSATISCQ